MKKIMIILIVLTAIATSIFFISKNQHKSPRFKCEKIERGDIVQSVTASGTVNPVINISVGTQVSGTIKKLYVDFNSSVKKGQLLAEIDPALFESQVESGMANLGNAKANLNKIKSITANDKRIYLNDKKLFEKNFIAKTELDLAETNYNSDLAQIESAQAQIAQAQASLKNEEANLRYTKIISPVNGTVVSRSVDVGQTVAASFQTPTLFLVAQDLTKMQIDTTIAEADIGKIKEGQSITFTVDGYPDMIFKGKVKQIRNAPTTVQNVVTYDVVISVNNKELKLKPGMTANVSIITAKKHNILIVRNTCLRFTMHNNDDDKDKKNNDSPKYKDLGIWISKKEAPPQRITIKTGISDGNFTEIISGNIFEGQRVIYDTFGKSRKQMGGGPGGGMRMF